MKVCLTVSEKSLDAQLDLRFGRCRYFMFVDVDTMGFETVDNPGTDAMQGAGVHAAQTVINKGAEAIITGNVGPNAYQALTTAGINVIIGVTGSVKEVVEQYRKGELQAASGSTVPAHFGMGAMRGIGFRRGGRGWRPCTDVGIISTSTHRPARQEPCQGDMAVQKPEEELAALEDYRRKLEEDLEGVKARIKELKNSAEPSSSEN